MMQPTPIHIEKGMSVYFFGTCLVDMFFAKAGLAAIELLEHAGLNVIVPPAQTCCGQPPYNSGYWQEAAHVAKQQLDLFTEPYPIVVPSGSCGAMMGVHYRQLFENTPLQETANAVSTRVIDWSRCMAALDLNHWVDQGAPTKVAYHPSCHLLRELCNRESPLQLLNQLRAVETVPFTNAEECCGFGGSFSLKMAPLSESMLMDKVHSLQQSGAEVLVSMDSGCLMQIEGAIKKMQIPIRCMSLPAFIAERLIPA